MPDLSIDAFAVAALPHKNYLPLTALPPDSLPLDRMELEFRRIPREHLVAVSPEDSADTDEPDVSSLAMAALGPPTGEQPFFLVRGPLRDSMVSSLARLTHESGWAGEDVGITHLEELGGILVFDLLDWAMSEESGATALICDEPLFADARVGQAQFAAVGLRVRRGPGPLRVLGFGEGAPDEAARGAGHRFSGAGPCDSWLAFYDALAAGRVDDGDRVTLHVRGPLREGWLSLDAVDTTGLRLVDGVSRVGS